ncbi:MAG: hypothetical protein HC892_14465 [Saprospiraceae bacterium]|nr:hypothetical protein [Saprospiraceae bacterium]
MIQNINFESYLKIKGISPSQFKSSDIETPLHWLNNLENEFKGSKYTDLGDAIHVKILQPELFENEVYLITDKDLPLNYKKTISGDPNMVDAANKQAFAEISMRNLDKTLLLPSQTIALTKMEQNIKSLKNFDKIIDLSRGIVEYSLFAVAEFDNSGDILYIQKAQSIHLEATFEELLDNNILRLKTRPDYFDLQFCFNSDLKSSNNISPQKFSMTLGDMGYNAQLAFGVDLIHAEYNIMCDTCYILAVENKPPYSAVRYVLVEDAINAGRIDYYNKLKWIFNALKTKTFLGYEIYSDVLDSEGNPSGAIWLDCTKNYYYKHNLQNLNKK